MTESYPLVKLDYFCDHSMKRFIEQVVRAFSGFQYRSLVKGVPTLNIVPCLPDQTDALVASIINKASDVTAPAVPVISVTYNGLELRKDDIQCPTFVSTVNVSERETVNGAYTGNQGRTYTVERLMPRPFAMLFDIDVWTSNKDQKYQLLEQMLTIFMPEIQIQNSENPIDWTAMTTMELEDVVFSSAAGPVGTDGTRVDYFTLKMRIPMWLSPPVKVSQRKRIEQIVTNIFDGHVRDDLIEGTEMIQEIVTPGNHCVMVRNNQITLLNDKGGDTDLRGQTFDWAHLVRVYGNLRPGTSTIRLSTTENIENVETDVVGTLDYDSENFNQMIFTIDPSTLPPDTLSPVTAVVNARKSFPGNGLPAATIGQRYLFQTSITGPNAGWGTLSAWANDIVEFDGTHWTVVYRPATGAHLVPDHVTNSYSGRQLRWSPDGWVFTYDGLYRPGYWRLHV